MLRCTEIAYWSAQRKCCGLDRLCGVVWCCVEEEDRECGLTRLCAQSDARLLSKFFELTITKRHVRFAIASF